MEKTVNFSVLKEKIIKTNELLSVLLEKNKSLEKSQKWIQHLKTKLELSKNEINTLKLKNETLSFNSVSIEKQYDSLKNEHNSLKQRFNRMEIESNDTINKIQLKYQAANQELEECQEKLNFLLESNNTEPSLDLNSSPKKKRKSPTKRKKSPVRIKDDTDKLTQKVNKLEAEKEKLISEKSDLQLEVFELKKKLNSLECIQDGITKDNYLKIESELTELKSKFKTTVDSKDKEISRLSDAIKNIEALKETVQAENERLKIEHSLSQEEILTLEKKYNQTKNDFDKFKKQDFKELKIRLTSSVDNKNFEIKKLLDEIKKLQAQEYELQIEIERLQEENKSYKSEISILQNNAVTEKQIIELPPPKDTTLTDLPQILEPPSEEKNDNNQDPSDEEISAIMKHMTVPTRISPLSINSFCEENEVTPFNDIVAPPPEFNDNKNPSDTNIDLKVIVNRRRNYIKRKKLIARKKLKQVDLYGALVALKRANINFIISSNTLLPSGRDSARFFNMYHGKNSTKFKQIDRSKIETSTKELNCSLSCCQNSYMVLKSGKGGGELLGFVGVKNEVSAHKEFVRNHKDNVNQVQDTRKIINVDTDLDKSIDKIEDPQIKEPEEILDVAKPSEEINLINENSETEKENKFANDLQSVKQIRRKSPHIKRMKRKICDRYVGRLERKKRKTNSVISVIKKKKIKLKDNDLNVTQLPLLADLHIDEEKCCPKDYPDESIEASTDTKSLTNNDNKELEGFTFKKPTLKSKSPKATFKRPVCSTRQSSRLKEQFETIDNQSEKFNTRIEIQENILLESPKSPTPESEPVINETPKLIPLEKIPENTEKMPTSKIEMLFNKLILFSSEEEALKEIVKEFSNQKPEYIAEAILERISVDFYEDPDKKYSPAPLMTDVQRTMLGFMAKLEKTCVVGVFEHYLNLAEERLLACKTLHELGPITRLYLAICKLQKNIKRMRKLCCDVFYFCGDFAVPFLFMVLTSWTEVLPHAINAMEFPIARVWVQIVYTRECNKPGYNLLPLRDLLIKFYGYPSERWDYNEFFTELFNRYLKNPSKVSDFSLLLYCKSRPEKWVHEKIEEHLKPLVKMEIQDNFKATLIILMGNLYSRFSPKSEPNYVPVIREWFSSLLTDDTPEVVKRCIYVSLNRLKKK